MSELCGFVYNKGHQKSRETTREIWRSEGELETLFLRLQPETGPPFYVVIRATQRSSLLNAKGVTSFLSYFKTLSIGQAPGIEPATFHSAVKRFTNGANTAAVKKG